MALRNIILLLIGLLILIFLLTSSGYSQEANSEFLNFKPYNFQTNLSADGRLGFAKEEPGFGIEQIRWNNYLSLQNNLTLGVEVKSNIGNDAYWYEFDKRTTKLSQLYLQYSGGFTLLDKKLWITTRAGKLDYYPSYTDPRLIIENLEQFTDPPSYYGASLNANVTFLEKYYFTGYLSAISGDLNSSYSKPEITNAYLRLSPKFTSDFGMNISTGKFEGTKYAFNEAHLYYTHTFDDIVSLNLKAGKLTGLDETPYGLQISIEGYFKYIMIGGSFERRINQINDVRYILFYWSILNPPGLVNFLNSYQFIYDTDRDILRFNIPFLTINFK